MKFENINKFFKKVAEDIENGDWSSYSRESSARDEDYKKALLEKTQFFYSIVDAKKIITNYKTQRQFPFWSISELLTEIFAMNPPLMIKYKPTIVEWSYELQDDKTVEYSYGRRWSEFRQVLNIIDILSERQDSKRAVIDIFTPYDTDPRRSDVPCTTMYMFKIRDNKLNMTVFYRSHDLFSGVKYDFILSSFMNQLICMAVNAKTGLDIQPGTIGVYEDSLHVYTLKDKKKLADFISESKKLEDCKLEFDIMYKYETVKDLFDDLWRIVEVEQATYHGNFIFAKDKLDKINNPAFRDMSRMYYNRNLKYNIDKSILQKDELPMLYYETNILRW